MCCVLFSSTGDSGFIQAWLWGRCGAAGWWRSSLLGLWSDRHWSHPQQQWVWWLTLFSSLQPEEMGQLDTLCFPEAVSPLIREALPSLTDCWESLIAICSDALLNAVILHHEKDGLCPSSCAVWCECESLWLKILGQRCRSPEWTLFSTQLAYVIAALLKKETHLHILHLSRAFSGIQPLPRLHVSLWRPGPPRKSNLCVYGPDW